MDNWNFFGVLGTSDNTSQPHFGHLFPIKNVPHLGHTFPTSPIFPHKPIGIQTTKGLS